MQLAPGHVNRLAIKAGLPGQFLQNSGDFDAGQPAVRVGFRFLFGLFRFLRLCFGLFLFLFLFLGL